MHIPKGGWSLKSNANAGINNTTDDNEFHAGSLPFGCINADVTSAAVRLIYSLAQGAHRYALNSTNSLGNCWLLAVELAYTVEFRRPHRNDRSIPPPVEIRKILIANNIHYSSTLPRGRPTEVMEFRCSIIEREKSKVTEPFKEEQVTFFFLLFLHQPSLLSYTFPAFPIFFFLFLYICLSRQFSTPFHSGNAYLFFVLVRREMDMFSRAELSALLFHPHQKDSPGYYYASADPYKQWRREKYPSA